MSGLGWIGPAITATDNLFNRANSWLSAKEAQKYTLRNMDKSQDFQREGWKRQEANANTAHQRAVADMRGAGLNPVLALGSPSATLASGGGSSPAGQGPGTPPTNDAGAGVTSALMAKGQLALMKKQAGRIDAQTELDLASAFAQTAKGMNELQNRFIKSPLTDSVKGYRAVKGMLGAYGDWRNDMVSTGAKYISEFLNRPKKSPGQTTRSGRELDLGIIKVK